ncbi:aldolase/citrate lyase family protein [soil metagenome]
MLAKAASAQADAVVFDLEDSVPLAERVNARTLVSGVLANWQGGPRLFVRINAPRFEMLDADLQIVLRHPDVGIVVPKVDRPVELSGMFERLGHHSRDVIVTIETARSLLQVEAFADTPGVDGLFLGGEDLTQAMGMRRTIDGSELTVPRILVVAAARAAGIVAYDTICPEFRDLAIVARDADIATALGFDGKFAIHPAQIEPIAKAFTPSDEEVDQARKIVDAYDEAVQAGRGAVAVDGQMIDPPVAERARAVLNRANRS